MTMNNIQSFACLISGFKKLLFLDAKIQKNFKLTQKQDKKVTSRQA